MMSSNGMCSKGLITIIDLFNLYGDTNNTAYIQNEIKTREDAGKKKIDFVKAFGEVTPQFEQHFKKADIGVQDKIISEFGEAKRMGLLYPIVPNEVGVHSLTGWEKYRVFELAFEEPKGTRVYIIYHKGKLYICSIGYKQNYSNKQKQKKDILNAESYFKAYVDL